MLHLYSEKILFFLLLDHKLSICDPNYLTTNKIKAILFAFSEDKKYITKFDGETSVADAELRNRYAIIYMDAYEKANYT